MTYGFEYGGGVRTVAQWLWDGLLATGRYSVAMHDLATFSRDTSSRRLMVPTSWLRRDLRTVGPGGWYTHWGANAVELEIMRYRPRRQLTAALRDADIVQVVSGAPACAAPVVRAGVPVVLQVASLVGWERPALLASLPPARRAWCRWMTRLVSRVERDVLSRVDAVLVENAALAEHVRSVSRTRLLVAPPGVDTDRFVPAPDGWRRDGYLLSVCRMSDPRKGLDRLILAYAEMRRLQPSIGPLVLAGRHRPEPSLLRTIDRLGLRDRVLIRSEVPAAELVAVYQGAAAFLQTSHEEGLGISVLEAMACGLPVVATETNGTVETVRHGETGWLVPQGPAPRVAIEVAERTLDLLTGRGADFGSRGRVRCLRKFSSAVALKRFTDVYDRLAPVRRAGGPDAG
ncbi:glycosyltransferase family 4 protein [Micromonospora zhanjiangensis]|uniref:Glycosyltransferase family 4 protein n=1 Tax=Micromonospora zhanjiangensis TaxID=1522057 RepID=A0ABV8KIZ8_9ACTN